MSETILEKRRQTCFLCHEECKEIQENIHPLLRGFKKIISGENKCLKDSFI
jgi:hypothetical protein